MAATGRHRRQTAAGFLPAIVAQFDTTVAYHHSPTEEVPPMELESPRSHVEEAQMILDDMQRPIEMRYAGAQAHALLAIAKLMLEKKEAEGEG
jgi:hypothetical protein